MSPTNDANRGIKRSFDDLESEEALQERFGKLLWARLNSKNQLQINRLAASKEPEIFVIGYSSNGTLHKVVPSTWRNYAELWQATKQHPGQTMVETTVDSTTGLSWPTDNELARRANIFIQKALEVQKKKRLSRNKPVIYSPIAVSTSSQRLHPGASSALAPKSGDFFDNLAQAARQKCEQQTYASRVRIHQLSTMLRDANAKIESDAINANNKNQRIKAECNEQVQATESKHKDEVQRIKAECNELVQATESKHKEEAQRIKAKCNEQVQATETKHKEEVQRIKAGCNEQVQATVTKHKEEVHEISSKHSKEKECMVIRHKKELQGLTSKHDEEKRSLRKATQDAATELNRLKAELQKRSQELESEKRGRRQDEEDHEAEIQCLMSENKKWKESVRAQLEDKNRALQKKIDRIMAVANDDNSVLV